MVVSPERATGMLEIRGKHISISKFDGDKTFGGEKLRIADKYYKGAPPHYKDLAEYDISTGE